VRKQIHYLRDDAMALRKTGSNEPYGYLKVSVDLIVASLHAEGRSFGYIIMEVMGFTRSIPAPTTICTATAVLEAGWWPNRKAHSALRWSRPPGWCR